MLAACLRKGSIVINRVVARFYNGARVGEPFALGVQIGPWNTHTQFERVHHLARRNPLAGAVRTQL
jgi:acyl-CoA reductase-like NAD-dependent aldehyde dehydrogenase